MKDQSINEIAEDIIKRIATETRKRTFLDAAGLVDQMAEGYLSDAHKVRCRHVASELRAWAARTGSKSDG